MLVRRLIAPSLFALLAPFGLGACTVEGPGSRTDCHVDGCTIVFDRGVDARASVLGVDAKLVAVNGNTVTIEVAGQQVLVPVGESRPADGMDVSVREVTDQQVVVRISTGIVTTN
ncbi:hypothetical protein [Nocardia arizonensis]|uniref:hypothetical protein n=1 Tax=Nocardia arizonensis TaxID=1141647 RepID=UPI0006CF49F1|nr:hypothetical protein [Nocardia arizonensis]